MSLSMADFVNAIEYFGIVFSVLCLCTRRSRTLFIIIFCLFWDMAKNLPNAHETENENENKRIVVVTCLCTSICHCGFCDPSRFSLIHSTLAATIIIALTISRTVKTEQLFSACTRTRTHIHIHMFAMRIMNFECNESNQINGCLSSFLTPLTLPPRSPSPLLRTCFVFFLLDAPITFYPGIYYHLFHSHSQNRTCSSIRLAASHPTLNYVWIPQRLNIEL